MDADDMEAAGVMTISTVKIVYCGPFCSYYSFISHSHGAYSREFFFKLCPLYSIAQCVIVVKFAADISPSGRPPTGNLAMGPTGDFCPRKPFDELSPSHRSFHASFGYKYYTVTQKK